MQKPDRMIERRIVIGMIVSTDYLSRVNRIWSPAFFTSDAARIISTWCMEYFNKYTKAPNTDIEAIFYDKLASKKIPQDLAEEFEEEILPGLSEEYDREGKFNSGYLYDQTVKYFKAQQLRLHSQQIQQLTEQGRYEEAEKLAREFKPTVLDEVSIGLDLASEEAQERVERAFNAELQHLINYPGALGDMWNDHLVRGGFVGLMGPEKRGKTMWLIELAMRAVRQKCNVAFFEAGDMSEPQILRRICIYIAKKSDRPRYCSEFYQPVGDCVKNQLDKCRRPDCNCDFGALTKVFPNTSVKDLRGQLKYDELVEIVKENPDYEPCDSKMCDERVGSIWLVHVPKKRPLTGQEAKKHLKKFFTRYKRHFKLMVYPADTLTVAEMKRCLDAWERQEGFVPDVICVDYADLLTAPVREFRHRQDYIWKNLRALSLERHCWVITATQADAASYETNRLRLSNFSEDKRKYAHVTAMYGLNQDPDGREKELGIMRINELVVREGEFSPVNEVTVLQCLRMGRAFLESYK